MSSLVMQYACTQPGCGEFNVMKGVSTELSEGNLYFPIQPLCGECTVPLFRHSVERAANVPEPSPEVAPIEPATPALEAGEPVTIGTAESVGPLGDEVRAANAEAAEAPAQQ